LAGILWVARRACGDVAQLEERLLCKQEVAGSSPVISTPRLAWGFAAGYLVREPFDRPIAEPLLKRTIPTCADLFSFALAFRCR
jgi:hypothetical protein